MDRENFNTPAFCFMTGTMSMFDWTGTEAFVIVPPSVTVQAIAGSGVET
jgi:hypothetical protein